VVKYAEVSLPAVKLADTHVHCLPATWKTRLQHVKGQGRGWVHGRNRHAAGDTWSAPARAADGKQNGRTVENPAT